jgi:predicted HTH domain antitoxin
MTMQVTVELPEAALREMGLAVEQLPRELLEAAVLRWFEEGRLSQGQAATALGLHRGEFFDLLHTHRVSPIQLTAAELQEDFRSV